MKAILPILTPRSLQQVECLPPSHGRQQTLHRVYPSLFKQLALICPRDAVQSQTAVTAHTPHEQLPLLNFARQCGPVPSGDETTLS